MAEGVTTTEEQTENPYQAPVDASGADDAMSGDDLDANDKRQREKIPSFGAAVESGFVAWFFAMFGMGVLTALLTLSFDHEGWVVYAAGILINGIPLWIGSLEFRRVRRGSKRMQEQLANKQASGK